jgi:hypothetical protein
MSTKRKSFLLKHLHAALHDMWIKQDALFLINIFERLPDALTWSVRPVRRHCFDHVGERENARFR